MLRRDAITALLAGALPALSQAPAPQSLDGLVDDPDAAALLVDVATRRLIAVHGVGLVAGALLPPGSALNRLRSWERIPPATGRITRIANGARSPDRSSLTPQR